MSDSESKTAALSVGQRLCASRYVLQTKLFENPEGSAYWVGKDRDAREDVILFFPPPFLTRETEWLDGFLEALQAPETAPWDPSFACLAVHPSAKPLPFVVFRSEVGISLEERLAQCGPKSNWEDLQSLIETIFRCLMPMHHRGRVHGRLSLDHIRFKPDGSAFVFAPGLDRLVFKFWREVSGEAIPVRWDGNASEHTLQTGQCSFSDEVFTFALLVYDSLRFVGVQVQLPRSPNMEGRSRLGNLILPNQVLQVLNDASGRDQGARLPSLSRLAAKMGFDIHLPEENPLTGLGLTSTWTRKELLVQWLGLLRRPAVLVAMTGLVMMFLVLFWWLDEHQRRSLPAASAGGAPKQEVLISDASDTEEADTPRMLRGEGVLQLTTAPSEALVIIEHAENGEKAEDFSPVTWQGLIEGAYRLRIQAVGYQSTNVLTYLIQGGERTLHVDLQPALVKLKLNTEPSSGTFRLQDHQGRWHTGSLPAEVELPLGDYLVHFSLDGKTRSERVRLEHYEVGGHRHVCVFASSQLQLLTSPEGAEVWLDGVLQGRTPLWIDGLGHGDVGIEFRLDGFRTIEETVNLAPDQVQTIRHSLLPAN